MSLSLCLTAVLGICAGWSRQSLAGEDHETTQQCGDLNGDGAIFSNDALLVLRRAVGQEVSLKCPEGCPCGVLLSCTTSTLPTPTTTTTLPPVTSPRPGPPNIVVILADDLGWGDPRSFGNPRSKTPNIDGLAQQGMRFPQAYVSASVCSPTRAALMTGQFPGRHGIFTVLTNHEINQAQGVPDWLDPNAVTLPRIMQSVGYVTGHYGKWHLGGGSGSPKPTAYGIDESRLGDDYTPPLNHASERPDSSRKIVDEAIAFLDRHHEEPFFLNVWFLDPHAPLNPTRAQLKTYDELAVPGVKFPSAHQVYYATVSEMDRQIGRFVDHLDKLGLGPNTLIVFLSDNGPEDISVAEAGHSGVGSTGPFRGRKRSLYEGGVRTPFIARWLGMIPEGGVNESVIADVDLLPTFQELSGANLPDGFKGDGEDIRSRLSGTLKERQKPLFWEWHFGIIGPQVDKSPQLAMRMEDWKFLMNEDGRRTELYDLSTDPSELNNIATQNLGLVSEFAEILRDWRNSLSDRNN